MIFIKRLNNKKEDHTLEFICYVYGTTFELIQIQGVKAIWANNLHSRPSFFNMRTILCRDKVETYKKVIKFSAVSFNFISLFSIKTVYV